MWQTNVVGCWSIFRQLSNIHSSVVSCYNCEPCINIALQIARCCDFIFYLRLHIFICKYDSRRCLNNRLLSNKGALRAARGEGSAFMNDVHGLCYNFRSQMSKPEFMSPTYTYETIHTTILLRSCSAHVELEGYHLSIPCMLWRKVVKDIVTDFIKSNRTCIL